MYGKEKTSPSANVKMNEEDILGKPPPVIQSREDMQGKKVLFHSARLSCLAGADYSENVQEAIEENINVMFKEPSSPQRGCTYSQVMKLAFLCVTFPNFHESVRILLHRRNYEDKTASIPYSK